MLGLKIKKINPFLVSRHREFVGIELSANTLKLAHVRLLSAGAEVLELTSRNIGGLTDADLSKTVNQAFRALQVKKPHVINTIPSHLVITKNIEIPSTNPREIKEIINLQAGRHTPYSREEIIVDYIDLGTYRHSYTKILLVIVARNAIKRHFEIFERASVTVDGVLFAPEALPVLCAKLFKLEPINAPVNIVHIDELFTDFVITLNNKVVFVRNIPLGAQSILLEKEKNIVRFADEVKKSLEAYQSEDIEKSPQLLILTGAPDVIKDTEAALTQTLPFPVRTISYFANINMNKQSLQVASSSGRFSFLNTIAPLLAFDEVKINIIPEEVKLKRSFEEKSKELIKTGILVMTVFVLLFSILVIKIYFKTVYLKKIKTRYASVTSDAKKLEKDYARVSLIRDYIADRGYSLEVLAELYNTIPDDLELSDLKLDDKGRLSVRGTAESMSTVFSFVDKMSKSKYFKDVRTKYTSKRKESGKDVTDFEITSMVYKETTS